MDKKVKVTWGEEIEVMEDFNDPHSEIRWYIKEMNGWQKENTKMRSKIIQNTKDSCGEPWPSTSLTEMAYKRRFRGNQNFQVNNSTYCFWKCSIQKTRFSCPYTEHWLQQTAYGRSRPFRDHWNNTTYTKAFGLDLVQTKVKRGKVIGLLRSLTRDRS